MKGRLNTPQELKEKEFAYAPKRRVDAVTLPPFLEALFDARTASGAIGGALMGNWVSSSLGAIVGGLIGGVIGFMTTRRKDGQATAK